MPREQDARSFQISRAGSPKVEVTFLTPAAFRVHVLSDDDPAARLPEYMRVRSDSSYPPVDVQVDARDDAVTFTTAGAVLDLTANGDLISLGVHTPTANLINNWKVDARRKVVWLDLDADEHIYGFGDKRAALDQRGHMVEMLNRDAFASETNDSYKSIPFYMSSAGYGLFFHNFRPSVFDIGMSRKDKLELKASGGDMDFYVFVGDLKAALSQYTELTGRPALLPRWAFGYHQAKASYKGRQALDVAEQMRRRKLPFDVIYYDDWVEEVTRKEMIDALWSRYHARLTLGFGMPMFGRFGDSDESAFRSELASNGFVMVDQDNQPVIRADDHVESDEQDSSVAYLDYFSSRAVDHVFAAKWEKAIKSGAILGMVDFGEMDRIPSPEHKYWPSLGLTVAETRNLFGLVYPLSVVNGVRRRTGGRSTGMVRPGFAGTQRLGWSTTGDSLPTYRNFRAHTRAMLNLTLSGFSNVGQDIGGWDRKGPDRLYARWFAAGTFHPFMWSHGQGAHEPYAHGAAVEKAARSFLELRYRLVPYFYSLHELAHRTGIPVLRSFPLQESGDPAGSRIDDEYFVGDDILVAPLFNDRGDRKVYLPPGLWYDFFGERPPVSGGRKIERKSVPIDRLPVYVRAGAVIPLGPAMQYTGEKPVDPLDIHVFGFARDDLAREDSGAETRTSEFALYEDDGLTTDYQRGKFQRTTFRFMQAMNRARLDISLESGAGDYRSLPERGYQVHFHGSEVPVRRVLLDGKEIPQSQMEENVSGHAASWSTNKSTGDILIVIPTSSLQAFTVEVLQAGA
jgi:alpha-glucosidase